MKTPTESQIVNAGMDTNGNPINVPNGYPEGYEPGEGELTTEEIGNSWGTYTKGKGWTSLKVFTGKAVREWILGKFLQLLEVLNTKVDNTASASIRFNNIPLSGYKLVEYKKKVTITDVNGHEIEFDTIVYDLVALATGKTISFNPGTDDSVENMPALITDCSEGQSYPVSSYIPTRNGYTFAGWYLNGTRVTTVTMGNADITLVAHWNAQYAYKFYWGNLSDLSSIEFNYVTNKLNKLGDLIEASSATGWWDQHNLYIILPAKAGKTSISDYVEILDTYLLNFIDEFTIENPNNPNIVAIKYVYNSLLAEPLDDSNYNVTIIFK